MSLGQVGIDIRIETRRPAFDPAQQQVLGRGRYQRAGRATGYRNGHRERRLLGTFGPVTLSVPRARLFDAEGGDRELIPSYRKLLWSKAMVVSVAEKSGR